jgi:hypothetical protein|nr:MAG TPA: hypothetical protein [Caudoviricetes sp.]
MIKYIIEVQTKDRNFKAYLFRKDYLNENEIEEEKIRFCKELREDYKKANSDIEIIESRIRVDE